MRAKFSFEDTSSASLGSNDRREEAARDMADRVAARQREIDAQREDTTSPVERIQMWERLHALRLPRAPMHPLLAVIARETALPLFEIQNEQQRRSIS